MQAIRAHVRITVKIPGSVKKWVRLRTGTVEIMNNRIVCRSRILLHKPINVEEGVGITPFLHTMLKIVV